MIKKQTDMAKRSRYLQVSLRESVKERRWGV
jgi:hypothetical protein